MSEPQTEKKETAITHYLPYLGSFLIFLGVARLAFFYESFGIQIVSFLEFSEIITSFFDVLLVVFICTTISVIQNFLSSSKKETDELESVRQKIILEEDFINRFFLHIRYLREFLLTMPVYLIMTFVWHFFDKNVTYWTLLYVTILYSIAFILFIISLEIERQHHQLNSTSNRKRFIEIIFSALFLIGVVGALAFNQVNAIKENKTTYGVRVVLDNDLVLVSDSSNYYIGKTQNYLFIHHEKQKTTDVIPMARVKQITMPPLKKY